MALVIQRMRTLATALLGAILAPFVLLWEQVYTALVNLKSYSDIAWAITQEVHILPPQQEDILVDDVLNSSRVQKAIHYDGTEEDRFGGTHTRNNTRRISHRTMLARRMITDMAATQRVWIIRIAAYFLRKALAMLYECGVHVNREDIDRLHRAIAKSSESSGSESSDDRGHISNPRPVIYLPTHKSHLDYMLMTYLCYRENLPLPIVVAGDNLNLPIVGYFLRACGAFFIRRSFRSDNDPLYSAIFKEYIKNALSNGYSLEAFIEGGRSRTGKVLTPKTGVLQAVVDAVRDGVVRDVILVPIAFSYERIVENESHIQELSGGSKRKEKLMTALKSVLSVLAIARKACFGRVEASFAQPMSVRQLIRDSLPRVYQSPGKANDFLSLPNRNPIGAPVSSPDLKAAADPEARAAADLLVRQGTLQNLPMSPATRRDISYSLGYRVLYETNMVTLVLPAAVVATALLTEYSRGVGYDELVSKVYWIKKEIEHRGGRVADFEADTIDRIIYQVLGSKYAHNELVKRHKNRLMVSLYNPKERMELSLYRNQLIHYFVPEGILCCALYAFEKAATSYPVVVSKDDLLQPVRFLSVLFQLEFIYQSVPGGLKTNLEATLNLMVERDILCVSDDGNVSVNDDVGVERYLFLCKLFWHFIDSYWFVLLGGYFLLPNRALSEEVLIKKIQDLGETLYFHGESDLCEAICKETLQNALTLFEKQGVYEFVRIEGVESNFVSKGKRIVKLTQEYHNEGAIENKLIELTKYRKKARQYSSRRFKVKGATDVRDAIRTVRNMIEEEKHKKEWDD